MADYNPNYIPQKVYALIGQKAIIVNRKNQILTLQRSEKLGAGGKWSLPGGALEIEDPREGIEREIQEEVQLKVSGLKPFCLKSRTENEDFVVIIGYICRARSKAVKLNWEHDNYKWLTKDEALLLDLTPDGRFVVEQFDIAFAKATVVSFGSAKQK